MIQQKLRKVGNSYVVTIPRDVVEQLHLREGQLLNVTVEPLEIVPVMDADVRAAFSESWERNRAAYQYLADR